MQRRKVERLKQRLTCEFVMADRRHPGIVLDISPTGLFVQTSCSPPPGERVRVKLRRPGEADVEVVATIARRYVVPRRLMSIARGGVGLQIESASDDYLRLVDSARQAEAAVIDPPEENIPAGWPWKIKNLAYPILGCPQIIKKGEKVILDINFAPNSAELDEVSQEIVAGVADVLLEFPDINVAIRGFTDNHGSESHNRQLSDARAKSVMAYLVELGVDQNRMSAQGFGEDPQYFIGDNDTEEGRALNRRVEIESVE